ncbi:hypothetical protein CPS_0028 [Colwellia psychrerythraea 34H]|uniref:Uncharacterized protein n=1 Tax=Colwellia psychrerythraea (strain 34H / ATCC BAA-681) TaxID=167879 RepID=Q48AU0_COLP3|nr:hypothetical protein CPS_0028 [Colwellia psychrerythraea 34H]
MTANYEAKQYFDLDQILIIIKKKIVLNNVNY